MEYFDWFQIKPAFIIDTENLRKKFLKLSREYHPDFYTLASAEKQAEALAFSTLTNRAYKILSDFDARMRYILIEKGLIQEEGTAGQEQNNLPQDFLMEIMDINEEIMELEMEKNQEIFKKILTQIETIENKILADIQLVITNFSAETTPEELTPVKYFYLKKRYLLRIKEKLSIFAPA